MTLIRSPAILTALAADNLRASRGQAAYLIITLAITTAAWLLLAAVGSPYEGDAASTRITIDSQSGATPLPYARRLEAIPGAGDVFWYGLQVVKCTAATTVALNAFGGPGTDTPLAKHKVPAATIEQWNADPLAAVISSTAASKCGWRIGQGIEPPSGMDGRQTCRVAHHRNLSGALPLGVRPLRLHQPDRARHPGQGQGGDVFRQCRKPA